MPRGEGRKKKNSKGERESPRWEKRETVGHPRCLRRRSEIFTLFQRAVTSSAAAAASDVHISPALVRLPASSGAYLYANGEHRSRINTETGKSSGASARVGLSARIRHGSLLKVDARASRSAPRESASCAARLLNGAWRNDGGRRGGGSRREAGLRREIIDNNGDDRSRLRRREDALFCPALRSFADAAAWNLGPRSGPHTSASGKGRMTKVCRSMMKREFCNVLHDFVD